MTERVEWFGADRYAKYVSLYTFLIVLKKLDLIIGIHSIDLENVNSAKAAYKWTATYERKER